MMAYMYMVSLLGENMHGLGTDSRSKAGFIKGKHYKTDLCFVNDRAKYMKGQSTDWEKYFKSHI